MLSSEIKGDITQMLRAVDRSKDTASEELMAHVYRELRQIASARMAQESPGQTLQATALVHEAWMRLDRGEKGNWQNRGHFFGAAALAMRRILIEHARSKMRVKRGARVEHVNIEDVDVAQALPDDRILLVEEALQQLETKDPELARIVILKFFGGLNNVEVAEILGVTARTVHNKWTFAKAWLMEKIGENANPVA